MAAGRIGRRVPVQPIFRRPRYELYDATQAYYGEIVNANGLNNLDLGTSAGRRTVFRWRCTNSGTLDSVKAFIKADGSAGLSNYWNGTGGSVKLDLQTDDGNGGPSGSSLGNVTLTTTGGASSVGTWTFGTGIAVTAGTVYHMVWTNADASPTVNFVSLNCLYINNQTPLTPTRPEMDFAVLRTFQTGDPTLLNRDRLPIFDWVMHDGSHQGSTYFDSQSSSGQKSVNGANNAVRQNFTVTGPSPTVTKVWIWGYRQAGTTQDLIVHLKDSGGTDLATGTIPAINFPVGDPTTTPDTSAGWTGVTLSTPVTLTSGSQFFLELWSPGETVPYIFFPIQGGGSSTFGTAFGTAGVYTDGYLESTTNAGSLWSQHSSSPAFKLQAFFEATFPTATQNNLTFNATVTGTPTLIKQAQTTYSRTVTDTPTLAKSVAKTFPITETSTASFIKRIAKTFFRSPYFTIFDDFNTGANQAVTARTGWGGFAFFVGETTLTTDATPTYAGGTTAATYYSNYLSALTGNNAYTGVILGSTFADFYLYARLDSSSGNGYYLSYNGAGVIGINTMAAFVGSGSLGTTPKTLVAGDQVEFVAVDDQLEAWVNGVKVLAVTNTTYTTTSGYNAVEAQGPVRFDAFGGGSLPTMTTPSFSFIRVKLLTISATVTGTATFQKSVGLIRSATTTPTRIFNQVVAKLFSVTSTSTETMTKQVNLPRSVTSVTTPTFTRAFQRVLSFAATTTGTASFLKRVGLIRSATSTETPTLTKSIAKTVSVTSVETPTVTKQVNLPRSTTTTTTPSFLKQMGKLVAVTTTTASSFLKRVGLVRSVTSVTTPSFVGSKVISIAASVTVLGTATFLKQVGKLVSATTTGTPTFSRIIARLLTFSVTVAGTPTLTKKVAMTRSATTTGTSTFAVIRVTLLSFSVTVLGSPTFIKRLNSFYTRTVTDTPTYNARVGKTFSATTTGTPTFSVSKVIMIFVNVTTVTIPTFIKRVAPTFTRTVTGTPTFIKQVGKLVTRTVVNTPTFLKTWARTHNITTTGTPTMTKRVGLTRSATTTGTPSITRRIGNAYSVTVTGTSSFLKRVGLTRSVTTTGTPTFTRSLVKAVLAAVTAVTTASFNKGIGRTFNVTATGTPSRTLQTSVTYSTTTVTEASFIKRIGQTFTAGVVGLLDVIIDFISGGARHPHRHQPESYVILHAQISAVDQHYSAISAPETHVEISATESFDHHRRVHQPTSYATMRGEVEGVEVFTP